jgi:hypothetical protein
MIEALVMHMQLKQARALIVGSPNHREHTLSRTRPSFQRAQHAIRKVPIIYCTNVYCARAPRQVAYLGAADNVSRLLPQPSK